MGDVLERLRNLQDHYSTSGQLGPENEGIFGEAADEIESLRKQWLEMAGNLLGKIGQTNEVMRDATDRIEQLERQRS